MPQYHRILRTTGKMSKYYDIGFNMCDPMFQGIYNGKYYHESDMENVLQRAYESNVQTLLLTGSSIDESEMTIFLANTWRDKTLLNLYYTIGVHPCCVNEFVNTSENDKSNIDNPTNDIIGNEKIYQQMWENDLSYPKSKLLQLFQLWEKSLSMDNNFRAIGEIGLDYDRLYYSSKEMQLTFFEEQLKLSCLLSIDNLPLFLHMRNCTNDFIRIIKKFLIGFVDTDDKFDLKKIVHENSISSSSSDTKKKLENNIFYKFNKDRKFVVHSFTDSKEDMLELLNLSPNCYIGMNGASFRDKENIESLKAIPLNRLLIETDAPWCDIRRTHESWNFLPIDYEPKYKSVKRDKLWKLPRDSWKELMIKGRNEPCTMELVAQVVANVKKIPIEEVINTIWQTSCDVYGT